MLELFRSKIGADVPETPSYVFAHCFFAESVYFGKARVTEVVLI
jgi:hypothetical protein